MCGRFVSAASPTLLAEQFGVDEVGVADAEPDYNVAPRAQVMVVRERPGADDGVRRVLSKVRWGLVPSWAKTPTVGDRMINARAEGLRSSAAFRPAFEKRRCLIPADGFYEWKVVGPPSTPKGRPKKQPVFVHRRDGMPMAFAGLWAAWKIPDGFVFDAEASGRGAGTLRRSEPGPERPDPKGLERDQWLRSCVIVTTQPNGVLAPIHDRMPVVLAESDWASWLDPENHDVAVLDRLLAPAPDEWFEMWPVSTRVNSAQNTGPDLLEPVPAADATS